MIFEQIDIGRSLGFAEQCRFNLVTGEILHMEDATFRVPPFPAQIKFAMTEDFPFVEMQTEFNEFANSLRPILDYRLHRCGIA